MMTEVDITTISPSTEEDSACRMAHNEQGHPLGHQAGVAAPSKPGKLQTWILDTSTVYRVGMVRLGLALLVLGTLSAVLGGVLLAINEHHPWAALGLWSGTPVSCFRCL